MALFGRKSKVVSDQAAPEADSEEATTPAPESESSVPVEVDTSSIPDQTPRAQGPWDAADDYPDIPRVDLGGLLVPHSDVLRIQVQVDQGTGSVSQLSLVTDGSAVQLQPYAAPRSGGMWNDVRGQISSQINKSGGLVEEVSGPFGVELRAQVKGQDGSAQPARFCGVDGPRWFLRLVFLGKAARDTEAALPLEDAARQVVVIRGDTAMPMGNGLPLRVPVEPSNESSGATTPAASARPTISLPERGPEITEIR